MVQRLFEISGFDVLQQVEKTHAHLIELIDRFPARSENGKADVAILVDVGMQDLVEALDLWRLERVFLGGLEGKGDLRVPVEGSVLVRHNFDVKISD